MTGTAWCSLDQLYAVWPTASQVMSSWQAIGQQGTFTLLMKAAQEQCEAFAPVLAVGASVPASYTVAVAMQTRNLYNASKTDPSVTTLGEGEYAIPVYPLDRVVKQQLRPRTGRPSVG